jgi:5-carboxymethyl-2-hydroxymuconate isomerase
MPHLTLEYTDNLDLEVQPLLARLHSVLAATGAINLKGLKSRAVRHGEYRIADGNPDYAFVHVNLFIREGRPPEVQRELAQRVMAVLKETFGDRFDNSHLSLSVDIKEMRQGIALTFHNIPEVGEQPTDSSTTETEALFISNEGSKEGA